jgi:hypothetical protein
MEYIIACIVILSAITSIIGLWKIFDKAGYPPWRSLIPIYNIITLLRILGFPLWTLVFFFLPIINVVYAIILFLAILDRFNKPLWHFLSASLFGFIYLVYLGFSKDAYIKPRKDFISRWKILSAVITIAFVIGVLFSYSNYINLTRALLRYDVSPGLRDLINGIVYTDLFFFLTLIVMGKKISFGNPTGLIRISALFVGAGFVTAAIFDNCFGFVLGIGVVASIGTGLAFLVCFTIGLRWFPDGQGTISGIIFLSVWLGESSGTMLDFLFLSTQKNLSENISWFCGSVGSTIFLYGIISMVILFLIAAFLSNPQNTWAPADREKFMSSTRSELDAGKMLTTSRFYAFLHPFY